MEAPLADGPSLAYFTLAGDGDRVRFQVWPRKALVPDSSDHGFGAEVPEEVLLLKDGCAPFHRRLCPEESLRLWDGDLDLVWWCWNVQKIFDFCIVPGFNRGRLGLLGFSLGYQ